jgi:hypothetical protein
MSPTYRDALGAAQTRIAALEAELAEGADGPRAPATLPSDSALPIPAPDLPKTNDSPKSSLLGGYLVCSILVFWGLLIHASVASDHTPTTIRIPVERVEHRYGVAAHASPLARAALLYGRGADRPMELVTLFRGKSERLRLGAVNPATLEVVWMTDPFPFADAAADVQVAGTGRYLGVASRDTVYSVDTTTHGEVLHHAFDTDVRFICPLPNEMELAVQTGASMTILHLTSGQIRNATREESQRCELAPSSQERLGVWKATKEEAAAARRSRTPGVEPNGRLQEMGDYGLLPCLPRKGTGDLLVMLDRSNGSLRWEGPALAPNDGLLGGHRTTSILTRALVLTHYVTSTGDLRLVARDVRDGRLAWKTTVPGASMDDLVAEDDKIYALADGAIHRLDLATGHEDLAVGSW